MRFILSLLAVLLSLSISVQAEPLPSVESLDGKMKMEVLQLIRKNNIVTLKGNLSNLDDGNVDPSWSAEDFYLLNEEKGVKYFVLRDEEKRLIVSHVSYPGLGFRVKPRESMRFWAKFTAPPPEVKKINIVFEKFDILEGVAISDEG